MSEKQIIKVNPEGSTHEVEVRPVTILVTAANLANQNLEYPGRVMIDAEAAVYHADRLSLDGQHPQTETLFKRVFPDFPHFVVPDQIKQSSYGARHIFGLLDMSLKFRDLQVPFGWKHPEAHIHPANEVELGDIAIELALGPHPTTAEELEIPKE